ncbi:MAG TPA: hypothetical protein VGI15_01465 [Candidatus Cybelea sp.]
MITRYVLFPAALGSALLMLAGCNGAQPANPAALPQSAGGVQRTPQQAANRARLVAFFERRDRARQRHHRGVTRPSVVAKRVKNLLYVTDGGNDDVLMFGYPTLKPLGTVGNTGDAQGVCSDANGNVWVVPATSPRITEYAHGLHKPKATLSDAGAPYPLACSVDPTTGNLAMTNVGGPSGGGNVFIWANAKGSATKISDSAMSYVYFCGYDASGNLWVDGLDSQYDFVFAELPAGGQNLQTIALAGVAFPGGIEWDGTDIAIGDQQASVIDQISVSGSTATIIGTTPLMGSCDVEQFAVLKGKLFAPDVCAGDGNLYAYPAGGASLKTVNNLQYPVAAAISSLP